MRRVMLDTNIYGEIIADRHEELIKRALCSSKKSLLVYGCDIVRKELRNVGKRKTLPEKMFDTRKARIALLSLYDLMTESRYISTDKRIEETAAAYFKAYKELLGKSDERIFNDFLIVACAAVKGLDVVYSGDNKTMLSPVAIKAYSIVNAILRIRTPKFDSYSEFIKELRRWLP